jgi:rhamnogalacturonan endolyase
MKFKLMARAAILFGTVFLFTGSVSAATARYMEKLDRGLVAVKSGSGYFLSWRLFGTDPQDATFGFNIYKGTTKLNTAVLTTATCYQDNSAGTGTYTVKPVTNGVEGAVSADAIVIDNGSYLNIPLSNPGGCVANDCSCGDLDGDGQYEIVLKWDAANAKDNSQSGVTGDVYLDAYKLNGTRMWRIDLGPNIRAGAHYTQFLVYDFDGDGMAEIAVKTAPGTKDGTGNYLKMGPAAGADNTVKYANSDGYILSGPEWYTIFAGKTGAELTTVNYKPPRYGNLNPTGAQINSEWGDAYGNRVDRFLASVAYLDGERPSAVPCRGYYTRTCLWAVDWRGGKLTERWYFDTDSAGTGKDGKKLKSTTPSSGDGYETMGCHSLRQGDVDGDGFDEIVYGAMTVDHDGQGLYTTGLRHGDALHLAAMDPTRGGLQVWQVHEETGAPPNGNGGIAASFRDAATGKILWSDPGTTDNGRGCCGPMTAGVTGWQMWSGAGGLWDVNHAKTGTVPGSDNFTMWWGADLTRAAENGTSISPGLSTTGMTSCNGSKSTPCLTADLFGDWREELILPTSGSDALHIYTTTTPTTNRLYTLMHDAIYRMSVATENVAYNQPPEPGIYIGPNMTLPEAKPNIKYYDGTMVSPDLPIAHQKTAFGSSMKIVGNHMIVLTAQFYSMPKRIAVYDCSGKLVHRAIVKNNSVDLQKDFGLSNGLYVLRVNETVFSEKD